RAIADGCLLSAEGTFAKGKNTWSNGAQAAHVAIDPRTGHVEVVDCLVVEDVGRLINPQIVHGQTIGALVQGLGGVFLDHVIYDTNGQMLNASLADYLVPTATDFPRVRAVTLELRPSPSNPLGVKGGSDRQRRRCRARGVERPTDGIAALAAAAMATDRAGTQRRRGATSAAIMI